MPRLEESRAEIERLISRFGVVVIVASGGKGTGAGTMFPLAEIARRQRKLVIPIFVRPSFERHEVEKQRYDHALQVAEQFDAAKIRLIEILNDRGYVETDPQPQAVVWERMNRSDRPRAAWSDVRVVGPLSGRSVGSLGAFRRRRATANGFCGDRPGLGPRADRRAD